MLLGPDHDIAFYPTEAEGDAVPVVFALLLSDCSADSGPWQLQIALSCADVYLLCRLYAVGFATRQLHNCRFDDYGRSGSGSCIASGTAESAPHFLQMALQQRAQDCINDCLDCSLSDCAEQMTGISLKQLLKEADDGSFWAITMRHRYGEAVTHLKLCLMLRVFNAVSSLVSKPVHALASSERQQRPEMPARFMLCTTTVLRYAAESGVPGAGEAAIADNSSEVCQAVTDVHQLALLSPAPVEALVDPAVWWEWQKRILQLDSSCDVCGTSKQSSEVHIVRNCIPQLSTQVCLHLLIHLLHKKTGPTSTYSRTPRLLLVRLLSLRLLCSILRHASLAHDETVKHKESALLLCYINVAGWCCVLRLWYSTVLQQLVPQ